MKILLSTLLGACASLAMPAQACIEIPPRIEGDQDDLRPLDVERAVSWNIARQPFLLSPGLKTELEL